jgi:hypothetical protein
MTNRFSCWITGPGHFPGQTTGWNPFEHLTVGLSRMHTGGVSERLVAMKKRDGRERDSAGQIKVVGIRRERLDTDKLAAALWAMAKLEVEREQRAMQLASEGRDEA